MTTPTEISKETPEQYASRRSLETNRQYFVTNLGQAMLNTALNRRACEEGGMVIVATFRKGRMTMTTPITSPDQSTPAHPPVVTLKAPDCLPTEGARIEITQYQPGELPDGNLFMAYIVRGDRRAFVGGHKTRKAAHDEAKFHFDLHLEEFLSTEESEYVRNVAMWDAC